MSRKCTSSFYQQCQRVCADSEKDIDALLCNDALFQYMLEQRIRELQNTGFEIIREQQRSIIASAVSATWGFALECRTAFERAEQEIIDELLVDLPEIFEHQFLEQAFVGQTNFFFPYSFTNFTITPRISQVIREKYKYWTDQGFVLCITGDGIDIFFERLNSGKSGEFYESYESGDSV